MVKDDRTGSVARALALFVGAFALLNVFSAVRHGGFDANAWWIDFRPLPPALEKLLVATLALLLCAWAIRPRMSHGRTAVTVSLLVLAVAVTVINTFTFYRLRATGAIATSVPVPFSLLVMLAMLLILRRATRKARPLHGPSAVLAFAACAVAFPLAQIAAFGLTDYRRPADAILVFGARAYANGEPSDALEDRVLTAVDLYQKGLAPRLIFSGGPGDGALSEARVMRKLAIARGVPANAITTDDAGLSTDATVHNAAEILKEPREQTVLAVSHAWHLPRVKMRCQREGLTAYTVPADERGQLLHRTPYLVARELPAIWLYYLRAL